MTVQVYDVAAVLSPYASTPRTWNTCGPFLSFEYVCGLLHAANAAPSKLHWKLRPGSVKANVAVFFLTVVPGPDVIVGAVVRTVKLAVAGDPTLPTRSIPRTAIVCGPSARPL